MEKIFKSMLSGEIYDPADERLAVVQRERFRLLDGYNAIAREDVDARFAALTAMFHSFGEGAYIEQPLYANWAGLFVDIGECVYANFALTLVDDAKITIGDHTMIGPNVTITTATHPLESDLRLKGLQYNRAVHIGANCFIGAGAIICPGVTIGDNSVIGAGSVVTRDIPPSVVAYGNPCRVQRPIS